MDPKLVAIVYTTASATATASGADMLRLFHGTDMETATWIVQNGLNFGRMTEYCARYRIGAGDFWTSTSRRIAWEYSHGNAAVLSDEGVPAVLSFALPIPVVAELLRRDPPLVTQVTPVDAAYAFRPEAFATVNAVMTDCMLCLSAEVKLDE